MERLPIVLIFLKFLNLNDFISMKRFKNYWLAMILLLGMVPVVSSCDDDDDDDADPGANEVRYDDIALTASAEIQTPPVTSNGTGELDASYNMDTKRITYVITWRLGNSDDQTVGMHFHGPASTTENASIVIEIPLVGAGGYNQNTGSAPSSGTVSGQTRALSEAEEEQLLGGLWYLNIHSSTYPNGELRGQVQ